MNIDQSAREDVLRVASGITTGRDDATAVVINASPLLGWLEDSWDVGDLDSRRAALMQHHRNVQHHIGDGPRPVDDDPEEFLHGARVLHAFLIQGHSIRHLDVPDSLSELDEGHA